jgi:hypothetical protein
MKLEDNEINVLKDIRLFLGVIMLILLIIEYILITR